jgi:CheY-like chemotaxis protein
LLIDDNEDDTLLLRRAMESCCPSVTDVHSVSEMEFGKSYLQGTGKYADRHAYPMPRLIMLDVNLGRGSGRGFLEWAKAHAQFKTIPIVAITGDISSQQANRTSRAWSERGHGEGGGFQQAEARIAACDGVVAAP